VIEAPVSFKGWNITRDRPGAAIADIQGLPAGNGQGMSRREASCQ
jgi:hypothetical protein